MSCLGAICGCHVQLYVSPTKQVTKLDKLYLRKEIKVLRTFLQLKPLLLSTSKEQQIRPVIYGVKRWSLYRNSLVHSGRVGLAAITGRLVFQVDYAS